MTVLAGLMPPFAPPGRPAHFVPTMRMWLLTAHADVAFALRDNRFSAAAGQRERVGVDELPPSMLNTDPPDHNRLRAPGALLVGAPAVRRLRAAIEAEVDAVLTAAATAGDDVDVGAVIGAPLAAGVLARVLGVPDADRACFNDLADRTAVNLDPLASGARAAAGYRAMEELYAYFDRTLPAVAAADPDAPVARFATDPRLTRTETLSILGLCVVGGYQPLADLPATALAVLPAGSGATRRLAVDPGFARSTVEELLRLHTPIPFTARVTTQAVDLPSGRVPAGARVLAVVAAANRDPDVFQRPDEPVLDRTPNPHLAFGGGPHLCLGAPLVREVGAVLLGAFARRFPGWRPSGTTPEWAPGLVPRRLTGVRARLR